MGWVLEDQSPVAVDRAKVLCMLLLHDVVEIDAGDTFAYDETEHDDKALREAQAADRILVCCQPTKPKTSERFGMSLKRVKAPSGWRVRWIDCSPSCSTTAAAPTNHGRSTASRRRRSSSEMSRSKP